MKHSCKLKTKIYRLLIMSVQAIDLGQLIIYSGTLPDTEVELRSISQQNIPDFMFIGRGIL